jgi:restriction system protein
MKMLSRDRGGQAPTSDVFDAVGEALRGRLQPRDYDETGNGKEVRREARAQFTRLRMIDRGLLEKKSPRGIWTISQAGRDELSALDA